jgi:hypothetical protein
VQHRPTRSKRKCCRAIRWRPLERKTSRNDNSRFWRGFVQMLFDTNGRVVGACPRSSWNDPASSAWTRRSAHLLPALYGRFRRASLGGCIFLHHFQLSYGCSQYLLPWFCLLIHGCDGRGTSPRSLNDRVVSVDSCGARTTSSTSCTGGF